MGRSKAKEPMLAAAAFRYGMAGGLVYVQPAGPDSDGFEPAAAVDLATGDVGVSPPGETVETPHLAHGVAGVACLGGSWALVLVTEVLEVGWLEGGVIYKVTRTEVLAHPEGRSEEEERLLELLRESVNPQGAGRGLYYSPSQDLTLSMQQRQALADRGEPCLADPYHHLFWNGHLAARFIDAGAGDFIVRLIHGSVQLLQGMDWVCGPKHALGNIAIISRRSVSRAGCRHWRRGADAQGHAANFVETEQVMEFNTSLEGTQLSVAAFVQLRGSVPLLWMQPPNLQLLPRLTLGPPDSGRAALQAHFAELQKTYGQVQILSLLSEVRQEGQLQMAFHEALAEIPAHKNNGRLMMTHFDVHKECGGVLNSGFREKLLPKVEPTLASHGIFYRTTAGVQSRQRGVVRANCFDSLDRTNMAQQVMAARALEMALIRTDLLLERPGLHLDLAYRLEERALRCAWADHGDDLAMQYAGSGAMKSSYTRRGVVTLKSFAEDIAKVVARYFINAFADGYKQDALDLVLGHARLERKSSARRRQPRQVAPATVAAVLLAAAGWLGVGLWQLSPLSIVGGGGVLGALLACGARLVNRPTLLPNAHKPW